MYNQIKSSIYFSTWSAILWINPMGIYWSKQPLICTPPMYIITRVCDWHSKLAHVAGASVQNTRLLLIFLHLLLICEYHIFQNVSCNHKINRYGGSEIRLFWIDFWDSVTQRAAVTIKTWYYFIKLPIPICQYIFIAESDAPWSVKLHASLLNNTHNVSMV